MLPFYYSLSEYLKKTYHRKLYKLALYGGMTCPTRDGFKDTRGCIFCSQAGSGDFTGAWLSDTSLIAKSDTSLNKETCQVLINSHTPKYHDVTATLNEQFEAAKANLSSKIKEEESPQFIAYFQSYTNTYAPFSYLERLFMSTILREDVAILSIGTRPDCLSIEVIALLSRINKIKPVWVELGLQTSKESTAKYIRRGFSLDDFDRSVRLLKAEGINCIVHQIIGLPGETKEDCINTAKYIANSHTDGVKLQLLHVLTGTDLAKDYETKHFDVLSMEEYFDYLSGILPVLPPSMVIHRITGDGPENLLIAPHWSLNKRYVLNQMHKYFKTNHVRQGSAVPLSDADPNDTTNKD